MKYMMLLIIFEILFCGCKQSNNYKLEEVKKIIETRYYNAVEQDGEWVCGKEINDFVDHRHVIVYYDCYDNEIIQKEINENEDTTFIAKSYYYEPKESKLAKIEVKYPLTKETEIAYWKRNANGQLIEIEGEIIEYGIEGKSFEYDKQGKRIKEYNNNYIKRIKYNPENELTYASEYDIYNSTKELKESGICFIDKKTELLKREIKETYKYGVVDESWDIEYIYNTDGQKILESWNGAIRGTYFKVPSELSRDKRQEYIKHNYYNTQQPSEKQKREFHWGYNKQGDCIKEISINNGTVISESRRVYEYNEKGDWTKCLVFHIYHTPSLYGEEEKKVYAEIVIRNIAYF